MIDNNIELLSNIVIYNKYAKYLPREKRRETWKEITTRYVTMLFNKYALDRDKTYFHDIADRRYIEEGSVTDLSDMTEEDIEGFSDVAGDILLNAKDIYSKKVLPSMRAIQFAGPAIEKNEARIYNCGYMPMNDYRSFSELMFLLLGGTGDGYSVQFHHIEELPEVHKPLKEAKYLIGDSIEG